MARSCQAPNLGSMLLTFAPLDGRGLKVEARQGVNDVGNWRDER
jgi:hypothetical protein